MEKLTPFEEKVAEILEKKLKAEGIDPHRDDLTDEQIARIEELTKEAQDDAIFIIFLQHHPLPQVAQHNKIYHLK